MAATGRLKLALTESHGKRRLSPPSLRQAPSPTGKRLILAQPLLLHPLSHPSSAPPRERQTVGRLSRTYSHTALAPSALFAMFEKSLTDLIRGIRANKKNEEKYIATCLDEIRNEVRKNDPEIKAGAIRKLVYLHMHGYDMAWASFHVIEVMSSPKIQYKRLGYQAASVSFKQDTDVLMLCTNLIKKDLSSNSYHESALALHGLASIVTPDLGRDLAPDLIAMMNHSRPYIRKRVILVLYRVFLKYPEALRLAFPRLKEKLDDPDPAVVSAAVNVICELARRNPKSYLNLAPSLYGLLTNSTNNWMLIKIIKLFAALTPLEPRLVKKLRPQITNLIQSTSAMSLLYECIHTVIVGGMIGPETEGGEEEAQDQALARLLTSKLKLFIEEPDQNLKYLGLYALWKLLAVRPKAVIEHRDTILACLDDADVSIRMRALDIVTGMVTQSNLMQIVRKLMGQVLTVPKHQQQRSPPAASFPPPSLAPSILDASDRTRVLTRIIDICSKDTYANITDFEWYLTTLVDMVRLTRGVDVGNAVAQQLVNVTVRVPEVREFAVAAMRDLLMDDTLLLSATQLEKNNAAVLWAAAWICGEFRGHVDDPSGLITRLLARGVVALPPVVQAVFLQNALKLYAHWAVDLQKTPEDSPATTPLNAETFGQTTSELLTALAPFRTAADLEVQERACEVFEIIQLVHRHCTHTPGDSTQQQRGLVLTELHTLFKGELNPVASKAQKRVPVPEGLDLDAWIFEPEPEPVEESSNVEDVDDTDFWGEKPSGGGGGGTFDSNTDSPADADRKRAERRERQKFDPYYIPSGGQQQQQQQPLYDDIDVNEIPIVRLDLPPLSFGEIETGRSKKSKKGKSTRADDLLGPPSSSSSRQPQKSYNINRGGEMPDGPAAGDDDRESPLNADVDEITKAVMSVDLTAGADGEFDVMEPRDFPPPPPAPDKNTTGELLV
ncbi:adaptor-related protein complex 3 delta 1 subunit [Fimicolochytrium jonesii]|uniref:adaptor-related protein complex 3 delta 1 subunit n=1 Tax=Fimicolochytrium jonesii TaxID=1396493 RepID=UPI0022FDE2C0|nr:adaptor-related protein complex 3 delta 1 subunit [Fimicolochytrium jonesii]KAI8818917.1 adaptor-related protein complex 3 delta 1 subunit [Fimicolochytrium jonesii]